MSESRKRRATGVAKGAAWRTTPSPFGNQEYRREWRARIDALAGLEAAVSALVDWRGSRADDPITDQDYLWIEARLEERVAVLRFLERSHDQLRTTALTGETITEVVADFERRLTTSDPAEIEALAAELRRRFKPPIMPSNPYLRLEVAIGEWLIKRRSLGWFETPIAELRAHRNVAVLKEGWSERSVRPSTDDWPRAIAAGNAGELAAVNITSGPA
jgi:methane monooxygenase component A gamma chain